MSDPSSSSTPEGSGRGRGAPRGRGKSRGGLGKYLRARGRGRGRGRPAEFGTRLLLEGEGKQEMTEEEEAELKKELAAKYGRRGLGSNVDRYKEEEPELDSDGEPIVEPEVDLSSFLEKQRITDDIGPLASAKENKDYDDDDVDTSISHMLSSRGVAKPMVPQKGKVEVIAWDEELDELTREKKAAEATWDLKARFRAKSEKLKTKPVTPTPASARSKKPGKSFPASPGNYKKLPHCLYQTELCRSQNPRWKKWRTFWMIS
ncbi:hypothetical protein CVT24_001954 [Panaeolus cyanescens]|uniref:Uncharacterized protein n=1 Tax=Panaeolus cyanescens TaxID=181874 RepID=A0A409YHP7_9AGAR|nr:hypothetical protein CVT24_001954 [Panaeolus cyanescens]